MIDLRELTNKISALKALKPQIEDAIRDELDAQKMYGTMMYAAERIEALGRNAAVESSKIRNINAQERDHEKVFREMLKNTERNIKEYEQQLKDEQRKLADEKQKKEETARKKRDEEQRRAREDAARKAPLKPGYYGPYVHKR